MHHLQKEKENTQLFTRIFTPFSLKAELRITVQTVQFYTKHRCEKSINKNDKSNFNRMLTNLTLTEC